MKLFEQAGFPKGVVNVVTGFGPEAGQPLVDHPKVAIACDDIHVKVEEGPNTLEEYDQLGSS